MDEFSRRHRFVHVLGMCCGWWLLGAQIGASTPNAPIMSYVELAFLFLFGGYFTACTLFHVWRP